MIHNPEVRIAKMIKTICALTNSRYPEHWQPVYSRSFIGHTIDWYANPHPKRVPFATPRKERRAEMKARRRYLPGDPGVPGYSSLGYAGATPESAVKRAYRAACRDHAITLMFDREFKHRKAEWERRNQEGDSEE